MNSVKLRVLAQVLPFLLIAPGVAMAQTAPTRSEAAAAVKAGPQKTATQPGATQYSRQQIDQMIAPIALYPDQLLAQVLMAATYPQQLVDAAKWLDDSKHAELKDAELMAALEPLEWDPSVKGLVAFPQVVALMTDHIEWTEALGVAFATQQAQVMNRVQALRQLAMKSGKIDKVKQVSVKREGPSIVIVSAEPNRMYVPVYNPSVVYGTWPERAYPPVYLPPPRRFAESRGFVVETIEPGFEVIRGPVVAPLWGWARPDWRSQRITINTVEYTRITRTVRPPPDNYWRREGPVVLVPPAARPRPVAAVVAMPAGTVAPVAAAAVVVLPERARAQPNAIRVQTTTAQPGAPAAAPAPAATTPTATTAQPSPAPAPATTAPSPTTAQPSPTPPPATTAQPSAPPPSTTTAQPSASQPAQPPAAAAKPSTAESAAKPGTAEAEKARKPAAQTATGKPAETPAATPQAAAKPGETAGTQADKAKPAGAAAPERQLGKKEPGQTEPGRTETGRKEVGQKDAGQKEPAPPPAARSEPPASAPAAKAEQPAAAPAAERARERGPADRQAEPAAKTAPEPTGRPASAPQAPAERAAAPAPRAPEQATARPPAPPAGPRPAAEPAQGTSAPPARPGPAGPPGQRPDTGKTQAPGQSDAGDKKDR